MVETIEIVHPVDQETMDAIKTAVEVLISVVKTFYAVGNPDRTIRRSDFDEWLEQITALRQFNAKQLHRLEVRLKHIQRRCKTIMNFVLAFWIGLSGWSIEEGNTFSFSPYPVAVIEALFQDGKPNLCRV